MAESFLYGAATSAHQVEGNNVHSDWWAWEQERQVNMRSGRAADHYSLFTQDFELARALGHTAHRFSIEWARIEPEQGGWNKEALRHYEQVLTTLRELGLTSFMTLHHFTNPAWFAEAGGWTQGDAAEQYARYVKVVVEHLGHLVDFWVTINEPMVYATHAYWYKRWPPQECDWRSMMQVIAQLAAGHKRAYRVIHRAYPRARVGLAKQLVSYPPEKKWQVDDRVVAAMEDWWFNHRFLRMTRGMHDFIGVNYYFTRRHRVTLWPPGVRQLPDSGRKSDLGWSIDPDGLKQVLLAAARYGVPLYVTENGLADAADKLRPDYIRDNLRAVEEAQVAGADVRGYLHWSLIDNFEWDMGFNPRFGLVAVDYKTMERMPRPSAYVYKAIIDQASLSQSAVAGK